MSTLLHRLRERVVHMSSSRVVCKCDCFSSSANWTSLLHGRVLMQCQPHPRVCCLIKCVSGRSGQARPGQALFLHHLYIILLVYCGMCFRSTRFVVMQRVIGCAVVLTSLPRSLSVCSMTHTALRSPSANTQLYFLCVANIGLFLAIFFLYPLALFVV